MNKPITILTALLLAGGIASGIAARHARGQLDTRLAQREFLKEPDRQKSPRPMLQSPILPIGVSSRLLPKEIPSSDSNLQASFFSAPRKVMGDGTEIFGSLIYSNAWAGTTGSYGIYSFPASQYTNPELVYSQGGYEANGGGCYNDGKYYWNSFVYTEEMGYTFTTFCTYDFRTHQLTKQIQSFINDTFDLQQITNDLTYDVTTDKIYALANVKITDESGYFAKYYPALSEVDSFTGFATPIAQIPPMVAIAASPGGVLYGISLGTGSQLYSINKTTGDCIAIGPTGLDTKFTQSMSFDPTTGKLYWAAVTTSGATGLYEVNIETGQASRIFSFGSNEEFTGLYIPAPEIVSSAPGLCVIDNGFSNGNLSGNVTITAPSNTFDGSALSGTLTVKLLTDGGNDMTFTMAPGESKVVNSTLSEGIHNFTAWASNASGEGPRRSAAVYVGIDAPGAVGSLALETTPEGDARISWSAPEIGRHDGWIDPAQLTYSVTRQPDNVCVATGLRSTFYTDHVEAQAGNYWYEVTPWCGSREGVTTSTESGLFGGGSALPCRFSMATKDDFDLFTIIDANGDWDAQYKWGGWMYGPDFAFTREEDGICAVYGYSPESAADDWLITPPVELEQGKKYRLTFTMWTRGDKEKLEVTTGGRNTVAAQSVIMPVAEYNHKDHRVFTKDFTATTDGNNFFGFHITSDKKRFYLFISDIMVDEVPDDDAPAAVSDLQVIPDPQGEPQVALSFKAPSTNIAGASLAQLDKIEIYHGIEQDPIKVFNAPTPGASLNWTEDGVSGWMEYRIVPFAGGKAGRKAEARVFVGWDVPLAVTDITVSDAQGQPTVTWQAPTVGENGGYINPSALSYTIYRYEDDFQLLAKDFKGLSFTDSSLDGSEMQHLVAYMIIPSSPSGAGEAAASDYIVFGDPYEGNFLETFADASVHSTPWVLTKVKGKTQLWGVTSYGVNPQCSPVGYDDGMAVYSADGYTNDEGRMISPKLSIQGMNAPAFSFYLYHNYTQEHAAWDEPFEDRLIPELLLPDGTFVALDDAIFVDDLGTGWLKYSYSLADFVDLPWIRVSLHGITSCEQNIYVDHVQVSNVVQNDLQAYSFTGPSTVEAGKNAKYKLTVFNYGANDVAGSQYSLKLLDNGTLVKTLPGKAIASKEYQTFEFVIPYGRDDVGTSHRMSAEIDFAADELVSNNRSEVLGTTVSEPRLAEVAQFEAEAGTAEATLSWGSPDAFMMQEGFEEYTPFDTDDFGEYTMHDLDGNPTYGFQDIYFENTGDPQSFMVFNPVVLGIVTPANSLFPYDCFDPRNGSQVLACIQGFSISSSGTASQATNDDWFISPEVFGDQLVRFYAKSGDVMQGSDKYQVLYSSTDNQPSSFVALTDVISTGAEWEMAEVELPADARYFAIRCVSEDGFILMIDDLEFIAKAPEGIYRHVGYRLYRNGAAIQDFDADASGFADRNLADGEYEYRLSALYEGNRESRKSAPAIVRIGTIGVDTVVDDSIRVSATDGILNIDLTAEDQVEVYSASGVKVYGAYAQSHSMALPAGVYFIRVSSKSLKVIL